MSVTTVLNRLKKVKNTGPGKWIACCPVHEDKSPSLAIKGLEDGRVLLHCFGCGASAVEIIESLGIDVSEIFPPSETKNYPQLKHPFNALDVLYCLVNEATIIEIYAGDLILGREFTRDDYIKLNLARDRIRDALHLVRSSIPSNDKEKDKTFLLSK